MNVILETQRLFLKVFEVGDINDVKSFWGNDEVMEHCSGATPHEKIPKVIDFYVSCQMDKGLSVYAVVEKETGKVIGAAGFNVITSLETVELIYHFAKESWGKGYATEAANACVDIAKANGHVKKIYASADSLNTNSLKILDKIGFKYCGMKWFDDTQQEEPYYEMVLS
ncbi:GNAT family N-acetyltransferase [Hazenella coriacea]|uniref:Ribosomal-protein-alanine N-acetyltransferase n=1 Tax=Hazenella coriacea TaxID=1179467 RepID=A0A4R3L5L9_9BACL|nr:GNAT family N-acetyltransferase [Hazenella coriacea]TCS93454.1 ribosomal-protein-alanine N-acetyltransferase [Hazenella coriacea]